MESAEVHPCAPACEIPSVKFPSINLRQPRGLPAGCFVDLRRLMMVAA